MTSSQAIGISRTSITFHPLPIRCLTAELTSEQAFDMRNRMSSYELNFRPGTWFVPYAAYERASGYGDGVSTFVSDQNEYPVPFFKATSLRTTCVQAFGWK